MAAADAVGGILMPDRWFDPFAQRGCICTPVPSQTGGLAYSPDPECPIEAHRLLARDLIKAAYDEEGG